MAAARAGAAHVYAVEGGAVVRYICSRHPTCNANLPTAQLRVGRPLSCRLAPASPHVCVGMHVCVHVSAGVWVRLDFVVH
jgi:hypothetical protein